MPIRRESVWIIPKVDKQELLKALDTFDQDLRSSSEWADWEKNTAQLWVIEVGQKIYPPKKIISIATGISMYELPDGSETLSYLDRYDIFVRRLREPKLDEIFQAISERYHDASVNQPFAGNHEIKVLFREARSILEVRNERFHWEWHLINHPNVRVASSYGRGNWANNPWIFFLDKRETETTQDGIYVVYLFREDGKGFYLKLVQGTVAPQRAFGSKAADVLEERASIIRSHCNGLTAYGFDLSGKTNLGEDQKLAKLYEASTIAAKFYPADAIPDQNQLLSDLELLMTSYDQYILGKGNNTKPIKDSRPVALIDTNFEFFQGEKEEIQSGIAAHGEWAYGSGFAVRDEILGDEALEHLVKPFHVYIYTANNSISARLTIADFVSSTVDIKGIVSPWPEITDDKIRGKTRADFDSGTVDIGETVPPWSEIIDGKIRSKPRRHYVIPAAFFLTWFKVIKIEIISPPVPVTHFDMAVGLSRESNLICGIRFGYIFDDEVPISEN
jgi:hypothetical protein